MTTATQHAQAPAFLAPPLAALQFLTRIPVPPYPFTDRTLPRAVAFFPLVGALLGTVAALVHRLLNPHLPPLVTAVFVLTALVLLTGALHEDALADAADAFGLRHTRDRTLAILHDSRIGSFGGTALVLSLAARIALLTALPPGRATPILIATLTLSRFAILPLTLLPPASPEPVAKSQGTTLARQTSPLTLVLGALFTIAIVFATLHTAALAPLLATLAVTAAAAFFFHRRLGGITGDCFGATVQLVEITVLLTLVWTATLPAVQTGVHTV